MSTVCGNCGHVHGDTWWGGCAGTFLGEPCACTHDRPETAKERARRETAEDRWAEEDARLW